LGGSSSLATPERNEGKSPRKGVGVVGENKENSREIPSEGSSLKGADESRSQRFGHKNTHKSGGASHPSKKNGGKD